MTRTFIARYGTTCTVCETWIKEGDEATYAAFGEVVHVECPPDSTKLADQGTCPDCFEELPVTGVCGNCS